MPVTSLVPPRIIPARAGFTARAPAAGSAPPDHPRSRGVYPSSRSSPTGSPDHPRSRGVYVHSQVKRSPRTGSSPLARGLRRGLTPGGLDGRIIPARAGFTRRPRPPQVGARDHPRSRGVYTSPRRGTGTTAGSSPLARGLPRGYSGFSPHRRIIPARAGFTRCGPRRGPGGPDHPRSRGVYRDFRLEELREVGSSPLARGLRGFTHIMVINRGIIPARAGFTDPASTYH